MNAVDMKNVYKSYENGNIKALNGIDLTIADGEFVSIIGPSGSGKSTLLNMLGALDIPDSGSINVAGHDLTTSKKLNEFRAEKIGFIFQLHNLIPNISVVENIEIPMFTQKLSSKEMRANALKLLGDIGLEDKVIGLYAGFEAVPVAFHGGFALLVLMEQVFKFAFGEGDSAPAVNFCSSFKLHVVEGNGL
jgi:ABC-type lipoprotein export system ATPase subunit